MRNFVIGLYSENTRISDLHPNVRKALDRLCWQTITSRKLLHDVSANVNEVEKIVYNIGQDYIRSKKAKVVFSESFRLFCRNSKSKMLRKLVEFERFANADECSYITLRKGDRLITFNPKPETQEFNESGDWIRKGRQEIKISALFQRLYGKSAMKFFSNADIECATNEIKNANAPVTWREVDVLDIYNVSTKDWHQSSCMSEKPEYFFDIYKNNPDVFKGIVFEKNGDIIGRCLKVVTPDFEYFDRIYYKNAEDLDAIHQVVDASGAIRKAYNSYTNKVDFWGSNGNFTKHIEIQIKDVDGYFPYVDTLSYLYRKNYVCFISNISPDFNDIDNQEYHILNCTSGGYETEGNGIIDAYTGHRIDADDAVEVGLGRYEGEYTHENNCFWSEANSCWVLS